MTNYNKNEITLIDSIIGNEGKKIEILYNGERIARRVYYSKHDGLFILINNKKLFAYDFRYSDTIYTDDLGLPIEE